MKVEIVYLNDINISGHVETAITAAMIIRFSNLVWKIKSGIIAKAGHCIKTSKGDRDG